MHTQELFQNEKIIPTWEEVGLSSAAITINTPLVGFEDKFFFLKQYVSKYAVAIYDGKNNIIKLDINNPKPLTLNDKLLNRVGDYLQTGKISLGTLNFNNEFEKGFAIEQLRNMIESINMRFNLYVRANETLVQNVIETLKKGRSEFDEQYISTLGFQSLHSNNNTDNNEMLPYNTVFHGVSPNWSVRIWQTDFINACRQRFLWCNAYGTGLGKTSTSLLAVQDRQNFKNERALFAVPASSLNKWFKEAFVGSFKNQVQIKPSVLTQDIAEKSLFIDLMPSSEFKKIEKLSDVMVRKLYPNDVVIHYIHDNLSRFSYLKKNIDEQLLCALERDNDGNFIYNKIFLSHEHFYRLRLKETSAQAFIDEQMRVDDGFSRLQHANYELFERKSNALMKVLHEESLGKNKKSIFFEDLEIDILVADEAHSFKNNKEIHMSSEDGVNYNNVRFFPNAVLSNRGLDMSAKCHYVRSKSPTREGILCLTATPITNSPIEIYSMMSLILGEYFINKILGVNGISEFLSLFCVVEQQEEAGVDDTVTLAPVFMGLNNLKLLHELLHRTTYYVDETDERVQGTIKLPKQIRKPIYGEMNPYQTQEVVHLKKVYRECKHILSEIKELKDSGIPNDEIKLIIDTLIKASPPYVQEYLNRFHEDIEVTASTFNLMAKFENLILDEDLLESACVMYFSNDFKDTLEQAIEIYNKKVFKYTKTRLTPNATENQILKETIKNKVNQNGEETHYSEYQIHAIGTLYELQNKAQFNPNIKRILKYTEDNQNHFVKSNSKITQIPYIDFNNDIMILLDNADYNQQLFFIQAVVEVIKANMDKLNNNLSHDEVLQYILPNIKFNLSPKVMACLLEMKKEHDKPRGKNHDGTPTNLVKQLLFCDSLTIHFKISTLISQLLNIPFHKIAPLTGVTNGENDEVLQLQDMFNAEDDENHYQIVIANQKGEYAIDLQNGTQAIHLLTINWTPDSETQRIGRAARQGNQTDEINIYNYYTNQTFDMYKQKLVSLKDNWIQKLFAGSIDYVKIVQTINKEQQERMIMLMGETSQEEMDRLEEQIKKENELKAMAKIAKEQSMLLDFILNNPLLEYSNKTNKNSNGVAKDGILKFQSHYLEELVNAHMDRFSKLVTLKEIFNKINPDDFETIKKQFQRINFKYNYLNWSILGTTAPIYNRPEKAQQVIQIMRSSGLFDNKTLQLVNSIILLNKHCHDLIEEYCINFDFLHLYNNDFGVNQNSSKWDIFINNLISDLTLTVPNKIFTPYQTKYIFLNQWILYCLVQKENMLLMQKKSHLINEQENLNQYLNKLLFINTNNIELKYPFEYSNPQKTIEDYQNIYSIQDKLHSTAMTSYRALCDNEMKNDNGKLLAYPADLLSHGNHVYKVMDKVYYDNVIVYQHGYTNSKPISETVKELIDILNGQNVIKQLMIRKPNDRLVSYHKEGYETLAKYLASNVDKPYYKATLIGLNLHLYFFYYGIRMGKLNANGNIKIFSTDTIGHVTNLSSLEDIPFKTFENANALTFFKQGNSFELINMSQYNTFKAPKINTRNDFQNIIQGGLKRSGFSSDAYVIQPNVEKERNTYEVLQKAMYLLEVFCLARAQSNRTISRYTELNNLLNPANYGKQKTFPIHKNMLECCQSYMPKNNIGLELIHDIEKGLDAIKKEMEEEKQKALQKKRQEQIKRAELAKQKAELIKNQLNAAKINKKETVQVQPTPSEDNVLKTEMEHKLDLMAELNPNLYNLFINIKNVNSNAFAFTSPKSYQISQEVAFRNTIFEKEMFDHIAFYYGSSKDFEKNLKKPFKLMKLNFQDLQKTPLKNAWIMSKKAFIIIMEKILSYYSIEEFENNIPHITIRPLS